MPKTLVRCSDISEYATVAERVTLFYSRYPAGRIVTELDAYTQTVARFRALVFRNVEEPRPAATGWAEERFGDGEINTVACLENAETSAVGRALANLGFTASAKRASAEEMAKAARARSRVAPDAALQQHADEVLDALRLLQAAQRQGVQLRRAVSLTHRLRAGSVRPHSLARLERALRAAIDARSPRFVESAEWGV